MSNEHAFAGSAKVQVRELSEPGDAQTPPALVDPMEVNVTQGNPSSDDAAIPAWGRPTTYKGTPMRSRLEAQVAAALDIAHLRWMYEPRCFADQHGQYLPDFKLFLFDRVQYLECKGTLTDDDVPAVQRRMEIIWSSEPPLAGLMLWEGFPQRRNWAALEATGWAEG